MEKDNSEYTIETWKKYIKDRMTIEKSLKDLNKAIPKKIVEKYDDILREDEEIKKAKSKRVLEQYHAKKIVDPSLLEKRREYSRQRYHKKKLEKLKTEAITESDIDTKQEEIKQEEINQNIEDTKIYFPFLKKRFF